VSRIDEALRRAEQEAASARVTPMPGSLPVDGIAELAREAYASEEPPVAQLRGAVLPVSAPTPMVSPPSAPVAADFGTRAASANGREGTATLSDFQSDPSSNGKISHGVLESGAPFSFERIDARYAGKTVVDQEISPTSREQYRRLAASLHHAKDATGLTIVMVTSAVSGEGKTLTSSNLALTLSESYKKNVLLIDTDLRKPSLHSVFRFKSESGLSEGLASGSDRTVPIYQISSRLAILAAGRPTSDPIAHLTSHRMRRLLEEARATFDWIILDTPPVALLPDANLLSAMVDGAVLVVKAGATPYPLVERALDAVGRNKALGVVLNRTMGRAASDYYGYYSYSYGPSSTTPKTIAATSHAAPEA
jgi:capsular exopolysaccharide synthesis family protein